MHDQPIRRQHRQRLVRFPFGGKGPDRGQLLVARRNKLQSPSTGRDFSVPTEKPTKQNWRLWGFQQSLSSSDTNGLGDIWSEQWRVVSRRFAECHRTIANQCCGSPVDGHWLNDFSATNFLSFLPLVRRTRVVVAEHSAGETIFDRQYRRSSTMVPSLGNSETM